MKEIHGGCHCGNISYLLRWPLAAAEIPARACSCEFCTKHRGTYTSHPEARLEVSIADRSLVSDYRFGTATADFLVCRRCGVVPVVTSTIDGRTYAVVNVNTFDAVASFRIDPAATDFDGESRTARLARRARTWIPDVTVTDGAVP